MTAVFLLKDVLSKTCDAIKAKLDQTHAAAVVGSSIASLRYFKWKDPGNFSSTPFFHIKSKAQGEKNNGKM